MGGTLKAVGVVLSVALLCGAVFALAFGQYGLAVGFIAFVLGTFLYQKFVELEIRVKMLEKSYANQSGTSDNRLAERHDH